MFDLKFKHLLIQFLKEYLKIMFQHFMLMLKILTVAAKQRCTGFFCMDERFFNHLGPFYETTPPITNQEKITERSEILPQVVNNVQSSQYRAREVRDSDLNLKKARCSLSSSMSKSHLPSFHKNGKIGIFLTNKFVEKI